MTSNPDILAAGLPCPDVVQQIETIEHRIRANPADASHRWALFQWLCVAREWKRAVGQLQVFGQLDRTRDAVVQAYRDLIRAECWREQVMAGERVPAFVMDDMPQWIAGLGKALHLMAHGKLDAADEAREAALDAAPSIKGTGGGHAFEWIADSDSRLGPVCELIVAGSYRWLSVADIASWHIVEPAGLLDLVWVACAVTLHDGTALRGFMPARYAPSPDVPASGRADDNVLAIGRCTHWHRTGRSGVIGVGGKTWATSAGDIGIFELRDCIFGDRCASTLLASAEGAQ
ncbi:type VI secretion system accessory protein TagJ [Paraburkholderia acidisoli]|uniref:type VI secretion system accessory protein TagJ n=1 Tax=Paraburkholderia acidisoli TaxID=2571748 RepID=UPI001E62633C|nr:type VI secretion system accessory protein TagJ [Paraburkholderia acidisoli]